MNKVMLALEATKPGCTVAQMTDLSSLSDDVTDALMVAVVNAGPPITSPEQWLSVNKTKPKENKDAED